MWNFAKKVETNIQYCKQRWSWFFDQFVLAGAQTDGGRHLVTPTHPPRHDAAFGRYSIYYHRNRSRNPNAYVF